MGAVIETVNIEDVYPLVDEYGNNLATRDYSTKENQEYVKELARSMRAKGIPDEMVTLVRDGGIYRIKAGNSRVEAMKQLGTKTFPAIVEDESTEQAALETVIRTNTKKKYEAAEESRFVRKLQLFCDDAYVAEVTGMEAEKVAKVRRAAEVVDDAADDMSLLRLIAIGEFADDPEAVDALTKCKESEYATIAKRFESRRKKEKGANALREEIERRGIEIVEDAAGMDLVANVNKASMIPEELPDGCVAMPHSIPGFFMLLAPATEQGQSSGQEDGNDERARVEAIAAMYSDGSDRRREWLAEQLAAQSILPNLSRLVEEDPRRLNFYARRFLTSAGTKQRIMVGQVEVIGMFERMTDRDGYGITDGKGGLSEASCRDYVTLLDAMKADGYEPDDDEQDVYKIATETLEGLE